MLNPVLVIARKELVDAWRDRRAVVSAALYALMGPGVVGMVSLTVHDGGSVLTAMMSVFTLVAAFVGGMNVALDAVAGERERRSLLPLLMHPVGRRDLLLGKWLAVAVFALAGLALNVAGFALLLHRTPRAALAVGLIPLAMLAAALEVLVSTACRGVKEAHTYLSLLVFAPMGLGMFMVFSPVAGRWWWKYLPVAGQQLQLTARGATDPKVVLVLACGTVWLAAVALLLAAQRLEQDDVVYGG